MKVVAFNGSPRPHGNTMTLARDPGDYLKDEEGVRTFRRLGENMAALMKRFKPR